MKSKPNPDLMYAWRCAMVTASIAQAGNSGGVPFDALRILAKTLGAETVREMAKFFQPEGHQGLAIIVNGNEKQKRKPSEAQIVRWLNDLDFVERVVALEKAGVDRLEAYRKASKGKEELTEASHQRALKRVREFRQEFGYIPIFGFGATPLEPLPLGLIEPKKGGRKPGK